MRFLPLLFRTILGVTAALVCMELTLRQFASAGEVPPPRVSADSLGGKPVVRRQLQEGLSTYRFSASGARLTGHSPKDSGVHAIILGDSYVVAAQVDDDVTMGAQLEVMARDQGVPLDVRQYGWSNAAPAQYVHVANDVSRRWNPRRVFVVVSENDMDARALEAASARLRLDSTGAPRIVGGPMDTVGSRERQLVLYKLARYRAHLLGLRLQRKWFRRNASLAPRTDVVEAPPDSAELAMMPRTVVRALSGSYGGSLTIVFIAAPGVFGDSTPTDIERRFLDACHAQGVDCVSTREPMVARRHAGRIALGGPTFEIGNGHLNDVGHRVVAELMWDRLRPTP